MIPVCNHKRLFPRGANQYKANLNCHTNISDGEYFPEEIKEHYKAKGYSVVAFSDREVLIPHRDLKDEGFLPLTACEYEIKGDDGRSVHFNIIALDENNGVQLGFENVFIAFADIYTYPYPGGNLDANGNDKGDPNYQCVDMDFGGIGYYFTNGKVEQIRWFKGAPTEALRFTDMDENPLEISCGKSYIGFVDLDEYERFAYAAAEEEIVEEEIDTTVTENESETDF